jgi:succinate dehydrogenase / fumarate reductase membrane anchor subunit
MSDPAQALSKVIGRGSAHTGASHWRALRLTSLALLLLTPWLLVSLALLPQLDYVTVHAWASGLLNASLLALLMATLCWHSQLGVQVVLEDYVHGVMGQVCLIASAFIHVLLAVVGVLAAARLAFGAA